MYVYISLLVPSLCQISYSDTLAHTTASRDPALASCPASLVAGHKTPTVVYTCLYVKYILHNLYIYKLYIYMLHICIRILECIYFNKCILAH